MDRELEKLFAMFEPMFEQWDLEGLSDEELKQLLILVVSLADNVGRALELRREEV